MGALSACSDDLRGLPSYFYDKQTTPSYYKHFHSQNLHIFQISLRFKFLWKFQAWNFFFSFWEICEQQVTQKLLEAEKKKLTQLELQLDEDTAKHGISSVEKVIKIIIMLLIQFLVFWLCNFDFEVVVASCMDGKQTYDLYINIGGMAFAFFLFFWRGVGAGRKGFSLYLFCTVKFKPKKKNVNYDTKEIVHEPSPSLSSWKKFFFFFFS